MDQPSDNTVVNQPVNVMFVDDDPMIRRLLSELLERQPDINLISAQPDGKQALAAVAETPPDVILVDVHMPVMGGIELTRLLHERHPNVRVIAYTALADQQTLLEMLDAGALGVVYKESDMETLTHAIHTVVAGLSVFSPHYSTGFALPKPDEPLSDAERDLLRMVSRGYSNERIAKELSVSIATVKNYIAKLSRKLNATDRVTLAVTGVRLGIN